MIEEEKEIPVTICLAISKTFNITVPDCEDPDLFSAVDDQITLPTDLAHYTKVMFDKDLDLKAAKMPRYLKSAINDCTGWVIDDFEIIPE